MKGHRYPRKENDEYAAAYVKDYWTRHKFKYQAHWARHLIDLILTAGRPPR